MEAGRNEAWFLSISYKIICIGDMNIVVMFHPFNQSTHSTSNDIACSSAVFFSLP